MWNPLASLERSHGFLNVGNLPLVQVDVLGYRLGGEERTAPSGAAPGQFLQSLPDPRINANRDGCREDDFVFARRMLSVIAPGLCFLQLAFNVLNGRSSKLVIPRTDALDLVLSLARQRLPNASRHSDER